MVQLLDGHVSHLLGMGASIARPARITWGDSQVHRFCRTENRGRRVFNDHLRARVIT
jgi:hypothetical protein